MNIVHQEFSRQRGASLLAAFVMTTILGAAIAGVGTYVSHTTRLAARRDSWMAAYQYAEAGTVMACDHVNIAFTNRNGSFRSRLVNSTKVVFETEHPTLSAVLKNIMCVYKPILY